MSIIMFSNQDIADYYDQTAVHYRYFWKLKKCLAIHYGIWEEGVRNFSQALENTNHVLAEKAGIKSTSHVLDAGCGVGGSAIYLARKYGCRVSGITLSKRQVIYATSQAKKQHVAHLARFEVKNYCSTGYGTNSFDVVWALESTGSASNKKLFFDEACRILKPGGTLVMADYFLKTNHPVDETPILRSWLSLWAITDLVTLDDLSLLLKESGFGNQSVTDYTKEIVPSARRMYWSSMAGSVSSIVYNFFHKSGRFARNHYKSGFLQYKALKKGLWEYKVITAKKL